jgi:hypothetical protein
VKVFWDSTSGWKLQYSTDGTNYTTDFENYNPSDSAPKDNYLVIGRNYPNGGQEPFLGTIDLNNTYIKTDGQPWFGICPVEVKKHQIMGPVGYTVVGSPTIVDGVASGFSSSNYINTSDVFNTEKDFEIVVDANTGIMTNNDSKTIIRNSFGTNPGGTGFSVVIGWPTGKPQVKTMRFYILNSNGNYIANGDYGNTVIQNSTNYLFKFSQKFVNDNYEIRAELSSDGGNNWITEKNWLSALPIRNSGQGVAFGGGNLNLTNQFWEGSIDLNHTYIKINGKLWFWQPRETESIVVNGVEVWNKSEV